MIILSRSHEATKFFSNAFLRAFVPSWRRSIMGNCYQSDRRKCQRFNVRIPVKLSTTNSSFDMHLEATSINVCMNGLYCTVERYVPIFDKLLVTFISAEHYGIPAHVISQIEGVVVRVEPEHEEVTRKNYNVALFFQELSRQQQDALYSLLTSHTETSSATA